MSDHVRLACQTQVVEIPLAKILPLRLLDAGIRKTVKYQCIEASIRELGLIEPLVVYPKGNSDGAYILLDGHVRLMILQDFKATSSKCLISTDDEGFTYNHKVNRLSIIQEHFMILRAIKNGVSEERIAQALNVDVNTIRQKRDLLDGICREAVELLRDKRAPANVLRELRKVKPMRQIEISELMCAANNYSQGYGKCLVAATTADQLVEGMQAKELKGMTPEEISRMEHETETLGREFKMIEESHGKNVLNLVLVVGYLRKLTENTRVSRFLSQHDPEILCEFQKLVESRSLGDTATGKITAD